MGYILIADGIRKDCDSTARIVSDFFEAKGMNVLIRKITDKSQLEEALAQQAPDIAVIRLGGGDSSGDEDPGDEDCYCDTDDSLSAVRRLLCSPEPGIRAAARIRDRSLKTVFIFISDGNGYAEETYSLQSIGYLRRPVMEEKLIDVLRVAVQIVESRVSIVVNSDREKTRIYASDIIYVETMMRKLIFHTRQGDVIGYGTLGGILKQFPRGEFLKVSRFEAVSASWIANISKNRLILKNGTELAISSRMLADVADQYDSWRSTRYGVECRKTLWKGTDAERAGAL